MDLLDLIDQFYLLDFINWLVSLDDQIYLIQLIFKLILTDWRATPVDLCSVI